MGTHYTPTQNPMELASTASHLAAQVAHHFKRHNGYRPALCYRGMSGVAVATAVMLALWTDHRIRAGMCYIRKRGEDSHGQPVENDLPGAGNYVGCFVDDFVSGGATMGKVIEACRRDFDDEVSGIEWSQRSLVLLSQGAECRPFKHYSLAMQHIGQTAVDDTSNRYTVPPMSGDPLDMRKFVTWDMSEPQPLQKVIDRTIKALKPVVGMDRAALKYGAPSPRVRW